MFVKSFTHYRGIFILALIVSISALYFLPWKHNTGNPDNKSEINVWHPPDTSELSNTASDKLIRYGRALITSTAKFLGPKGSVAHISNGMNCQNCHLNAGTRLYSSNFALVATNYPLYRDRSGRIESVEFRINECMQRSLNGKKLDSLSTEMQSMAAYIKWVGKSVKKGIKPIGAGTEPLPFLDRPADSVKGQYVFVSKCRTCHGANGEGQPDSGSVGYTYPPLWGNNSYNVSAGMYRISHLSNFVKHNMPFNTAQASPQLSDEEAWDVAAFIISQQRPRKFFPYDWPDINTKPVDYPFGPYADSFSEFRHKFGPFSQLKNEGTIRQKSSK